MGTLQFNRTVAYVRIGLMALFLVVAVITFAGSGWCNSVNSDIQGNWQGNAIGEDGAPIETSLEVTKVEAKLRFEPPRKCTSLGKYVLSEEKVHTYRIITPSHSAVYGWCKKVRDGVMTITQITDNTLSVTLTKNGKSVGDPMFFKRKKKSD